jgi:hypothetical protein
MIRNRLFLLTVFLFLSLVARAQTGVYAEFSGAGLGVSGGGNVYGGTFGLYSGLLHAPVVSLGFDIRGEFMSGNGQTLNGGLGGVRIAVTPHVVPLKPYVEGLGGVGHSDTVEGSSTDAEYRIVGGIDWTILPRIDWRVVEVSGGSTTGDVTPVVISTGLVLRLP